MEKDIDRAGAPESYHEGGAPLPDNRLFYILIRLC